MLKDGSRHIFESDPRHDAYAEQRTGRPSAVDLVTGGAGFIGQHLVRALLARGRAVRVLDLAERPEPNQADWHRGSLLEPKTLADALEGVERVFHLAAIPHFWCKDKNAHERVNVVGTQSLLAAATAAGIHSFVHCSTEAVLLPEGAGQLVDGLRAPQFSAMPGPYTRSKLLAEEAVLAARGLHVVVVSPTAPIGPGDRGLTPPSRMLRDLLAQRYPAYLECVLNLVDVRDVAEGHILAAERGLPGKRYILGGENLRLSELLALVGKLSGRPMPKRRVPPWLALASAAVGTWMADRFTGRAPPATPEAVRLALAGTSLSSAEAEQDLGYRPQPLQGALKEALADLS